MPRTEEERVEVRSCVLCVEWPRVWIETGRRRRTRLLQETMEEALTSVKATTTAMRVRLEGQKGKMMKNKSVWARRFPRV